MAIFGTNASGTNNIDMEKKTYKEYSYQQDIGIIIWVMEEISILQRNQPSATQQIICVQTLGIGIPPFTFYPFGPTLPITLATKPQITFTKCWETFCPTVFLASLVHIKYI